MFDDGVGSSSAAAQLFGAESDCALIDLIAELHARESMLVERKLAAIAEFFERRSAEHSDAGAWSSTAQELAEAELGAALTMGRAAAGKLIGLGFSLKTRLHRTRAAMARGELDLYRVGLIDSATANVDDDLIDEVERQLLEKISAPPIHGGTGLTSRRLTAAIDRIVAVVDPEGMRERRRRALADRFVGVSAAEDGMARILGSIPAEDARAFDGRLRELAISVCRHDSRKYEQRRADALGALVVGSTLLPCDCGRDDCPQDRSGIVVVRRPLVHVVMLESALLSGDSPGADEPAHLDGYGVISAEHARDIAAGALIRKVKVPADAALESADEGEPVPSPVVPPPVIPSAVVYRPGAVLDTWVRVISGSCQWLHCDVAAWNSDLDHTERFDHRDPARGGKAAASNLSAYCRNHHRLKHSGQWVHTLNPDRSVTLTSATAHCYRTRPSGLLAGMLKPVLPEGGRRRRTRLENKAARVRGERRRQRIRMHLRMKKKVQRRTVDRGDDPPPF